VYGLASQQSAVVVHGPFVAEHAGVQGVAVELPNSERSTQPKSGPPATENVMPHVEDRSRQQPAPFNPVPPV
jgi:hypothetical protein